MKSRLVWIGIFFTPLIFSSCSEEQNFEKIPEKPLESNLENCDSNLVREDLAECQMGTSREADISIWTWNLEFFPQDGNTLQTVIELIEYYQPGIIAFQEINDRQEFEKMIDAMPLYEGWAMNLSGDLDLAFAYNTCIVSSVSDPKIILDGPVEPRPPIQWTASIENQQITLLNIHLKCCGDGVERRAASLANLHEYLGSELAEDQVILLGDFNDDINDLSLEVFADDTTNFRFADAHISTGMSSNWSYPSWPSDLDHILISNELFSDLDTASTLLLDQCESSYFRSISDHRPVSAHFTF